MRRFALACLFLTGSSSVFAQSILELPPPRLLPNAPVKALQAPASPAAPAPIRPQNPDQWRRTGSGPLPAPAGIAPLTTARPATGRATVPPPPDAVPAPFEPRPTAILPPARSVTGDITPVQFEFLAPEVPSGPPQEPPSPLLKVAPPLITEAPPATGVSLPPAPVEPALSAPLQTAYQQAPPPPNAPAPGAVPPPPPVTPPSQASGSLSYQSPNWLQGYGNQCDDPGCVDTSDWCTPGGCQSPNHPLLTHDNQGIFVPFLGGQIKAGDSRVLGENRFFAPLYQDSDRLLFTDLRGQYDDNGAVEGNFGLGFRTFVDAGWIFGMYGYYDILGSENNNNFHQGTVGVELMSLLWDFRVNGYFPETTLKGAGANAAVANGNIVINNFGEKAYGGVDFETGYRVGAWGKQDRMEVRWFVGGYFFDASGPGFNEMIGPKTRLEWRMYDLDFFGRQSRLEAGAEFTYDDVRDEQVFGFVRLRVPLSVGKRQNLSPLRRRMVDLPVRDMDVITRRAHVGSERALHNGRRVDSLWRVNAEQDWLTAIQSAGQNSLVNLDGTEGAFFLDQHQSIHLMEGQTLAGGGSTITLRGEHTGATTQLTLPGVRPTILHAGREPRPPIFYLADTASGTGNTNMMIDVPDIVIDDPLIWPPFFWNPVAPVIQLADRSTVQGINIVGGETGIQGVNVAGVNIQDVSIRHGGGPGIDIQNSQNVRMSDLRIRDGQDVGIRVTGSQHVAIQDTLLERVSGTALEIMSSQNVSVKNTTIRDMQPHNFNWWWPWSPLPIDGVIPMFAEGETVGADATDDSSTDAMPVFEELLTDVVELIDDVDWQLLDDGIVTFDGDIATTTIAPLIYMPPNGIVASNVQNLTISNNTIEAGSAVRVYGTRGDVTISDNRLTFAGPDGYGFFDRGISVVGQDGGQVNILRNQIHAAAVGHGQVGIEVWGNTQAAHEVQVRDNILTGLSQDGILIYDGETPGDNVPQIPIAVTGNVLEYVQLGADGWGQGGRIDALQVSVKGQGAVTINDNQVRVVDQAPEFAVLGSSVGTWGNGQVQLNLNRNQIPIAIFDLVQNGNGEIELLSNSGNTFETAFQNNPAP